MPGMPRIPGKPTKIAYKILGVPANIKDHKSPNGKKVDARLVEQETILVR